MGDLREQCFEFKLGGQDYTVQRKYIREIIKPLEMVAASFQEIGASVESLTQMAEQLDELARKLQMKDSNF